MRRRIDMRPRIAPSALSAASVVLAVAASAQCPEYVIDGRFNDDWLGGACANAGDITNDGSPEIAFGLGDYGRSRIEVYSSADGTLVRIIYYLDDPKVKLWAGRVIGPGDLNRDGVPDLVASIDDAETGDGLLFLSGANGSVIARVYGHTPNAGFRIASVGDVNRDGTPDILYSGWSPYWDENRGGAAVVSGRTGGMFFSYRGDQGMRLGDQIAAVGDIDGDQRPDFGYSYNRGNGRVLVERSGASGAVLRERLLPADAQLASVADLDGDSIPELLVSDYRFEVGGQRVGRVAAYSGASAALLLEIVGDVPYGTSGFFGYPHDAGDVDGDGKHDIMVSRGRRSYRTSEVLIYSGNDGATIRHLLAGDSAGGFGHDSASLEDLDDDGRDDFVIGEPYFGGDDYGRAHVFLSGTGGCDSNITGIDVPVGTLISGGAVELEFSDDNLVRVRSTIGGALTELHTLTLDVGADTDVPVPFQIDVSIESRIDHPAGVAAVFLRNFDTGRRDLVGLLPVSDKETIETIARLDAVPYTDGGGVIALSIAHRVVVPLLAFDFDSFFDLARITVR